MPPAGYRTGAHTALHRQSGDGLTFRQRTSSSTARKARSLPLSATSVSRWCRACRSRTAVVGSAWSPPTSTCRYSAELAESGSAWGKGSSRPSDTNKDTAKVGGGNHRFVGRLVDVVESEVVVDARFPEAACVLVTDL
jgi:hypothetical protein